MNQIWFILCVHNSEMDSGIHITCLRVKSHTFIESLLNQVTQQVLRFSLDQNMKHQSSALTVYISRAFQGPFNYTTQHGLQQTSSLGTCF